jgi:fatty acid desaturase
MPTSTLNAYPYLVYPNSSREGVMEVLPQIQSLEKSVPNKTLGIVFFHWSVILVAFYFWNNSNSWLLGLLIFFIVGAQQCALLAMMHDFAHLDVIPNSQSWNDFIARYFLSYPFFFSVQNFRKIHFQHHRTMNTAQDPDFVARMKNPQDWIFPMSRLHLIKILIFTTFSGQQWRARRTRVISILRQSPLNWVQHIRRHGGVFLFALITLVFIWQLHLISAFIHLWILPMQLIVFPSLRFRSICEHFAVRGLNDYSQARTFFLPWYVQCFVAPHGLNYHLDHHLFPQVPWYNLPQLHRLLKQIPAYANDAEITVGFLGPSGIVPKLVVSSLGK